MGLVTAEDKVRGLVSAPSSRFASARHVVVETIERHLLNDKEFWGPFGLRTLTPDEPKYTPAKGYWKGPTWVVSSYMMTHALARHGYRDKAIEEAVRVVDLLVRDLEETGGMNENYDPDTGAPAAGTNFLSWNLLAEHWVDELRTGADPTSLDEPALKRAQLAKAESILHSLREPSHGLH